jgi:hypothetical protein
MSNTRYIEIDSQYRDRNMWPKAAEFEIPIAQSGNKNNFNALDPVSDAAIMLHQPVSFVNTNLGAFGMTGTVSINSGPSVTQTSDPNQIVIKTNTSNPVQREDNFYAGAVIEAGGTSTTLTPVQRRRITASKFLYNDNITLDDYILFSLQNPFTDLVVDGVGISISNPSTPTDTEFPFLYIPTGENANNFYVNCIIQRIDSSLNVVDTKSVKGYDGLTRLAQLNSEFSDYNETDSIIIRRKAASEDGALPIQVSATKSSFILPSSSSSEPKFYIGSFIRFPGSLSATPTTTRNGNETRKIINYDTNHIVTVSPGFTDIPLVNDKYEILPFTRDNANPFVYTGSMVSQQEMVCYEIKLVNLVLPNRILTVGKGSLITFYPYVYVQLSNVSAPGAGNKHIIYSNNPNSTKALFRAPITDVPNLTSSTFIKIDGDGMVQTIKFKPNDNLYFCVTLPSGEVFETVLSEFDPPRIPNVMSQISAMFAIRRV